MNLFLRRWIEPFLLSLGGPFRSPRHESDALNHEFQAMSVVGIFRFQLDRVVFLIISKIKFTQKLSNEALQAIL